MFPLGLVAAGIWLMVRKKPTVRVHTTYHSTSSGQKQTSTAADSSNFDPAKVAEQQSSSGDDKTKSSPNYRADGKIRFDKMMGDMYIDCEGYSLSNFEVSMGIGDLDIKVAGGVLSKGLNRIIISGFIGDMRIFVPKDLNYFAHCSNFVGDVETGGKRASGFGNTVEHHTPDYDKAESKLYIAANSFIGDIKIYPA